MRDAAHILEHRNVFGTTILTPANRLVLVAMVHMADEQGHLTATAHQISNMAGVSGEAVRLSIRQLEFMGLLTRKASPPRTNQYTITLGE